MLPKKINQNDTDVKRLKFCTGYGQFHTANPEKRNPKPYVPLTLDELIAGLETPESVAKDRARWAIFSTLYKDPLSRNHELQRKHGEFLAAWSDVDKLTGRDFFDVVKKVSGIVRADLFAYTSSSAKPENPKCRIVAPYAHPVSGRDHVLIQKVFNDKLEAAGIVPDRATERAGQLCYLPNNPNGIYDHFVDDLSGPFDPLTTWADEIQALKDAEKAHHEAFLKRQSKALQKAQARIVSGSNDVMLAFKESFSIPYCLDKYGYRKSGDKRTSPNSESGNPGVSITPDGQKWFSHHSSDAGIGDPHGEGSWGDSWDLFKYWEHGNDEAAAFQAAGDMFMTESGETFNQANRRQYAEQKGEEETKRMFEQMSNPSDWQEPQEIRAELLPVEPLLESMIPDALLPMVQDVASRMSVPLDFVAVPLLVVLGSIVGTGCRIRPKRKDDWTVTPNLWGAIIGAPSVLKTPALNEVMKRTVNRLEGEEFKKHGKEQQAFFKQSKVNKLSEDVLKAEYKRSLKEERK